MKLNSVVFGISASVLVSAAGLLLASRGKRKAAETTDAYDSPSSLNGMVYESVSHMSRFKRMSPENKRIVTKHLTRAILSADSNHPMGIDQAKEILRNAKRATKHSSEKRRIRQGDSAYSLRSQQLAEELAASAAANLKKAGRTVERDKTTGLYRVRPKL